MVQSATALPISPTESRRNRMRQYLIVMGIRVTCIPLVLLIPGWEKWIFAAGAIFLPYFAVVLANAGSKYSFEAPKPTAQLELEPLPTKEV